MALREGNVETIPQGIPEEADDAPKKFRNIDKEEFAFNWDGKPFGGIFANRMKVTQGADEDGNPKTFYTLLKAIQPDEVVSLPKYLANFAAYKLAKKMFKRDSVIGFNETPPAERVGLPTLTNEKEEKKLRAQILADNPEVKAIIEKGGLEIKSEAKKEEPVEVPIGVPEKFKCDKCDFEAKSKIGLISHMRTHKEKKEDN